MKRNELPVWPLLLSFLVTTVLWNLMSEPRTPPTCMDGWRSPSIGTIGACSHHGGVKYEGTDPTPIWKKGVAIGAGLVTFLIPTAYFAFGRRRKPLVGTSIPCLEDDASRLLQAAIDRGKRVAFTYTGSNGQNTQRTVQPKSLAILEPFGWDKRSLTAFCHLRNADRTFLLSRVSELRILE